MQTKFDIGDSVYYFINKDADISWLGYGKVVEINISEDSTILYYVTNSPHAMAEEELSSTPAVFYDYKIRMAEDRIKQLKKYVEGLKADKEKAEQKDEEE